MSHNPHLEAIIQKLKNFHSLFPFGLFTKHYICFIVDSNGTIHMDNRSEPEMSYSELRYMIDKKNIGDFFNVPPHSTASDWFTKQQLWYGDAKMVLFREKENTPIKQSNDLKYSLSKITLSLIEIPDTGMYSFGVISFKSNPAESLFSNLHPYALTNEHGTIVGFNQAFRSALGIPASVITGKEISSFTNFSENIAGNKSDNNTISWREISRLDFVNAEDQRMVLWPDMITFSENGVSWSRKKKNGANAFAEYMMPISYTKPIQIEYEIDVSEGIPPGLCIMAKRGDYNFPDESGYLVNFQEKENVVWVKKMGHPIHAVNCDFASLRGKRKISISVVNGTISLSIDNKVIISHYDTDYPTDPGYNGLMFCIPGNSQCTLKNLKIFESNDTIALHNTLTQTVRLSGNGDRYYRIAKSTTTWGSEPVWVYQFINITEYVKLLNKYRILENEKQRLQDEINKQNGVFAGKSEAVQKIIEKAKTIAAYPVTILIEGETGCGKEVLAKHVHDLSERRNKPFVKLDCTTLPPNLMETELFGHEKGAFTGADKMRIGRIEQADGGTLFIDEISNLSLSAQAKLLDFLHSFEISRIGSNRRTKVNVRVIAASNIPLQLMVKKKLFREDLFYRINSIQITIPPLRERKIDIPVLAELFVNEACVTLKKEKKKLDPEVFPVLMTRKWPGNARELRSVIFEAVMLAEGNEISPANVRIGGIKGTITSKRKKRVSIQTITDALNEAGGNIAKAAKKLGIGRMTIYRKVLRNQAT